MKHSENAILPRNVDLTNNSCVQGRVAAREYRANIRCAPCFRTLQISNNVKKFHLQRKTSPEIRKAEGKNREVERTGETLPYYLATAH